MTLVGFRARNHGQQVLARGARDDVDDRGTDPAWFAELHRRFAFTIDVAAASHNAKLPHYFDAFTDGLTQPWAGERVWCNPPFSDIAPWIRKAWAEHGTTDVIVMLVPANRTEQGWWQDLIEPFRDRQACGLTTEFVRGRPRFIAPGRTEIGANERPPFGCCLLIWRSHP